jgi:transcriptional regulator with XRE-family HTH domain
MSYFSKMIIYKQPQFPPCLNLRKIREERGLTQTQLSRMLVIAGYNISASYISRFELGYTKPWETARKGISKILGIDETQLFS